MSVKTNSAAGEAQERPGRLLPRPTRRPLQFGTQRPHEIEPERRGAAAYCLHLSFPTRTQPAQRLHGPYYPILGPTDRGRRSPTRGAPRALARSRPLAATRGLCPLRPDASDPHRREVGTVLPNWERIESWPLAGRKATRNHLGVRRDLALDFHLDTGGPPREEGRRRKKRSS